MRSIAVGDVYILLAIRVFFLILMQDNDHARVPLSNDSLVWTKFLVSLSQLIQKHLVDSLAFFSLFHSHSSPKGSSIKIISEEVCTTQRQAGTSTHSRCFCIFARFSSLRPSFCFWLFGPPVDAFLLTGLTGFL